MFIHAIEAGFLVDDKAVNSLGNCTGKTLPVQIPAAGAFLAGHIMGLLCHYTTPGQKVLVHQRLLPSVAVGAPQLGQVSLSNHQGFCWSSVIAVLPDNHHTGRTIHHKPCSWSLDNGNTYRASGHLQELLRLGIALVAVMQAVGTAVNAERQRNHIAPVGHGITSPHIPKPAGGMHGPLNSL